MRYYTAKEVAEILKVHKRSVARWIKSGQLPAVLLGNRYRVSHEDLERFLEERRSNRIK